MHYNFITCIFVVHTKASKMKVIKILAEDAPYYKEQGKKINTSSDAAAIIRERIYMNDSSYFQEVFVVMTLNRKNVVTSITEVARGGLSGVAVPRQLMAKICLEMQAAAVIVAHNHPSENRKPSRADVKIYSEFRAGLKCLGIDMIDGLIITEKDHTSFADEWLFEKVTL